MELKHRLGNMTLIGAKGHVVRFRCSCKQIFSVKLPKDVKPETDGTIKSHDGSLIQCTKCKKLLNVKADPEIATPDLPTEWKFFALYISRPDHDETLGMVGHSLTMIMFTHEMVPLMLRAFPDIHSFTVKELTEAEYKKMASITIKEQEASPLFQAARMMFG